MKQASFIIITGLSGSGKGTFLRALEDRGYFCVDNLPVGLLNKFYELILKSDDETSKVAMVIDVRDVEALQELPNIYTELRNQKSIDAQLWFLEASEERLVSRFSETRRPHPLDPNLPVLDAIARERDLLASVRAMADHVLDTTAFTVHDLRKYAVSIFEETSATHLLVSLVSFGFKNGVPINSDLVFDVRFLPNPNFVPELKSYTGNDANVIEYMEAQEQTGVFLDHLRRFLDYLLPQYEKEGKSYITIAVGCTGGRHRSVFIANAIARYLESTKHHVKVTHRDSDKKN